VFNLLKKYWFFQGIAVMVAIAFLWPQAGHYIRSYKILHMGIFLSFLLTGLSLETASIIRQLKNLKVLAAALLSSLVLFPALAYTLAGTIFGSTSDFAMGVLIIGVAPVTIASGTVMTAMALGNVPLSLFICVLCNFFSIITIPIILNLILQFGESTITLPVMKMFTGLVLKVLIPTLMGQLLRPVLHKMLAPYKNLFSIFNQFIVLMIILNAISNASLPMVQAGSAMVGMFLFMIFLHTLVLMINRAIAGMIRLDLASTAAFTIHTSQKTLTISYIVWSGYFSIAFPMALIPPIAYHLTQMIMDTFVAQHFRKKASHAARRSPKTAKF
jgi:solute carrier family 10 (sodium/bile acid cotransporter), member 7